MPIGLNFFFDFVQTVTSSYGGWEIQNRYLYNTFTSSNTKLHLENQLQFRKYIPLFENNFTVKRQNITYLIFTKYQTLVLILGQNYKRQNIITNLRNQPFNPEPRKNGQKCMIFFYLKSLFGLLTIICSKIIFVIFVYYCVKCQNGCSANVVHQGAAAVSDISKVCTMTWLNWRNCIRDDSYGIDGLIMFSSYRQEASPPTCSWKKRFVFCKFDS